MRATAQMNIMPCLIERYDTQTIGRRCQYDTYGRHLLGIVVAGSVSVVLSGPVRLHRLASVL